MNACVISLLIKACKSTSVKKRKDYTLAHILYIYKNSGLSKKVLIDFVISRTILWHGLRIAYNGIFFFYVCSVHFQNGLCLGPHVTFILDVDYVFYF